MTKTKLKSIFKDKNFLIPFGLFLLVLASRLLVLNGSIDFFDSSQYIWRTMLPNLKEALSTGHAPYHPGYIFWGWLVNRSFLLFGIENVSLALAIPSAVFGSLTVLVYYLLVNKIFKQSIALLSAVLVAIVPFFWIANVSILVDPTMIFFYILSLYLSYLYLEDKNYACLIGSGFALGFSMWAHTQIAFWCLGFVALFFYKVNWKNYLKEALRAWPVIIGPVFFIGIYLYLLVSSGHNTGYWEALTYLLGGNAGDHMSYSLMPGIKNFSIILTAFVGLISLLGFAKLLFDKRYREFGLLAIWLFPALFLSALYLYANLYGRACLISIFPAMIAVSYFLLSWNFKQKVLRIGQNVLIILVIGQLLYVSIPIIKSYATNPAVLEELAQLQYDLKQGGLYITSNQAKTLYYYQTDKLDVIWEMPKTKIDADIDQTMSEDKPIYMGQDAVLFPYYLYDGHNWEIKSTNLGSPEEHQTLAANYFSRFNFQIAQVSQLGNKTLIYELLNSNSELSSRLETSVTNLPADQTLIFGRLIDDNTNYQVARNMLNFYSNEEEFILSPEKINYHDLIYNWYNKLVYRKDNSYSNQDPLIFTYSDKSGYFSTAIPDNQAGDIQPVITSYSLSTDDVFVNSGFDPAFSLAKNTELDLANCQSSQAKTVSEITNQINSNQSFYILINKQAENLNYQLCTFDYQIELTDKIDTTALPSQSGQIVFDNGSESETVRKMSRGDGGLLFFGPWINLQAGEYQIELRAKIDNYANKDELGSFSVTADSFLEPLVEKELSVADFNEDNYTNINIQFSSDTNLQGVEFKLESIGAVDLFADNIAIKRIN